MSRCRREEHRTRAGGCGWHESGRRTESVRTKVERGFEVEVTVEVAEGRREEEWMVLAGVLDVPGLAKRTCVWERESVKACGFRFWRAQRRGCAQHATTLLYVHSVRRLPGSLFALQLPSIKA